MNLLIWVGVLTGAAAGMIGFWALKLNAARGLLISASIGAIGGYFGGSVLAPVLSAAADESRGVNLMTFLVALASAMVMIKIADMLYEHFEF